MRTLPLLQPYKGLNSGCYEGSFLRFFVPAFSFLPRFALLVLVLPLLTACATGAESILKTVEIAFSPQTPPAGVAFNPNLAYLRVSIEDRTLFLARGYIEADPRGNVEIWYSAEGEVIRLQNGRIIGTTGLATDWRNIRYTPSPAWDQIGTLGITSHRIHDEMPGYRFDVSEAVTLRPIPAPSSSKLVGIPAQSLRWLEEQSIGPIPLTPPWRYALSGGPSTAVVYAEQCFSEMYCLSWQRWPVSVEVFPAPEKAN